MARLSCLAPKSCLAAARARSKHPLGLGAASQGASGLSCSCPCVSDSGRDAPVVNTVRRAAICFAMVGTVSRGIRGWQLLMGMG